MGSGQKAMYEEEEEARWNACIEMIKSVPAGTMLSSLEKIEDSISRFEKSEPSLTRGQWYLLDSIKKNVLTCLGRK